MSQPATFFLVNSTNDEPSSIVWALDSDNATRGIQTTLRTVMSSYRQYSHLNLVYLDVPVIHVGWQKEGHRLGLPTASA
jgi:hypothetical protein